MPSDVFVPDHKHKNKKGATASGPVPVYSPTTPTSMAPKALCLCTGPQTVAISVTTQLLGPFALFFINLLLFVLAKQPGCHLCIVVLESCPSAPQKSCLCSRSILRSGPSPPPSTLVCLHRLVHRPRVSSELVSFLELLFPLRFGNPPRPALRPLLHPQLPPVNF